MPLPMPAFLSPADFLLIGRREAGEEEAVAVADSNGCAAAPNIAEAKLRASLELIGKRRGGEVVVRHAGRDPALTWVHLRNQRIS